MKAAVPRSKPLAVITSRVPGAQMRCEGRQHRSDRLRRAWRSARHRSAPTAARVGSGDDRLADSVDTGQAAPRFHAWRRSRRRPRHRASTARHGHRRRLRPLCLRRHLRQRGTPGTGTDRHRSRYCVSSADLTHALAPSRPAPSAGAAVASSGQRARGAHVERIDRGRARGVRRRPRRSSRRCRCRARAAARAASSRVSSARRSSAARKRLVGGDAAGDRRDAGRWRRRQRASAQRNALRQRSATLAGHRRFERRHKDRPRPGRRAGRSACALRRTAVLRPAKEKCGSARPSIGRGRSKRDASPGQRRALDRRTAGLRRARAASPSCRRPRRARRRWWCRGARSGRRPRPTRSCVWPPETSSSR